MTTEQKTLLLLLPGLDGTGRLFSPFLAALPETIEPKVLPLPARRAATYDELASALRPELPRDRSFALLGESFSGPIALRLAAERPEGLLAVILVASFHQKPVRRWLAALQPLARLLLSRPAPAWAARRFLAGDDAPPDLVAEFRRATSEAAPGVLASRVAVALDETASRALGRCKVPLLYVRGSRDRLDRREIANELRHSHPAIEIATVESPHFVLQRRPIESAQLVSQFLQRATRPPSFPRPR